MELLRLCIRATRPFLQQNISFSPNEKRCHLQLVFFYSEMYLKIIFIERKSITCYLHIRILHRISAMLGHKLREITNTYVHPFHINIGLHIVPVNLLTKYRPIYFIAYVGLCVSLRHCEGINWHCIYTAESDYVITDM